MNPKRTRAMATAFMGFPSSAQSGGAPVKDTRHITGSRRRLRLRGASTVKRHFWRDHGKNPERGTRLATTTRANLAGKMAGSTRFETPTPRLTDQGANQAA